MFFFISYFFLFFLFFYFALHCWSTAWICKWESTYFRLRHGPQERGTRFRLRTTRYAWEFEVVCSIGEPFDDGEVGVIAIAFFVFRGIARGRSVVRRLAGPFGSCWRFRCYRRADFADRWRRTGLTAPLTRFFDSNTRPVTELLELASQGREER